MEGIKRGELTVRSIHTQFICPMAGKALTPFVEIQHLRIPAQWLMVMSWNSQECKPKPFISTGHHPMEGILDHTFRSGFRCQSGGPACRWASEDAPQGQEPWLPEFN